MKSVKTSLFLVAVVAVLAMYVPAWAADGMVSYWRFDEGEGTTAYDSVGANDGTLINEPVWTIGQVGGALSFDGDKDYVDCGNDSSLDVTDAITVAAWVKRPNFETHGTIAGKTNGNSVTAGYGLFSYIGGLEYNFYSGGWRRTTPRVTITPNEWHYVVGTFDGNNAYLYVDGEQKASLAYTGAITAATGYSFHIAFWRPGLTSYLNGIIDEVAIYNRALTPEEIQQHYWNGLQGQDYLAIEVAVDIKPGSYPNAINLGSKGLIPVAILSSEDFGATSVDPDTVELAGSGVAVRGKGNRFLAHEEDVNGDGLIDLVVQVATANLDPDSFQDGYVVLTGTTYDELPIWGVDEIIIVPTQE